MPTVVTVDTATQRTILESPLEPFDALERLRRQMFPGVDPPTKDPKWEKAMEIARRPGDTG